MRPCTAKRRTSSVASISLRHVAAPLSAPSPSEILVHPGEGSKTRVVKLLIAGLCIQNGPGRHLREPPAVADATDEVVSVNPEGG